MSDVLDDKRAETFKGLYAFSRSYIDAPNPALELLVNDIGFIGLPLSKREADVIKSACLVATKHPQLDTVQGPWVIDNGKVSPHIIVDRTVICQH